MGLAQTCFGSGQRYKRTQGCHLGLQPFEKGRVGMVGLRVFPSSDLEVHPKSFLQRPGRSSRGQALSSIPRSSIEINTEINPVRSSNFSRLEHRHTLTSVVCLRHPY